MKAAKLKVVPAPAPPLRLDLGCGPNKREGFLGVDSIKFNGVDQVVDLRKTPLPWKTDSVDEIHCSHFLEHLHGHERVGFMNEVHRIMKPGAKLSLIVPHWSSSRAYGDVTHQWPPVVEMFFYYLSKDWRAANAPHVGLTCDFDATWGYSMAHPWQLKNQEQQQFGLAHYREVAQDLIATLTKKP